VAILPSAWAAAGPWSRQSAGQIGRKWGLGDRPRVSRAASTARWTVSLAEDAVVVVSQVIHDPEYCARQGWSGVGVDTVCSLLR